jgi:heterotetrameric sarcosine oxidase gamma subunit
MAVCEVLARSCGVDFERFAVDTCRRTRLANIAVVIDRRAAERCDLYLARSYSPYLRDYLEDAAV